MIPLFRSIKLLALLNIKHCHSVFGIHKLIKRDTPNNFKVYPIAKDVQSSVISIIKEFYLSEHVFVKYRHINITQDHAIDEYLRAVLRQGNSLCAKTEDGSIAGVCINCVTTPIEVQNLYNFAFYRQDVNLKDLLSFMAKLDETPNLWKTLQLSKIFEIKMLTVLPQFRRQGLAVLLAERSKALALEEGHKCVRLNCINDYDYKIAEHCMMRCIAKYPLHRIRSPKGPYINEASEHNKYLRVYLNLFQIKDHQNEQLYKHMKMCQINLDECLE